MSSRGPFSLLPGMRSLMVVGIRLPNYWRLTLWSRSEWGKCHTWHRDSRGVYRRVGASAWSPGGFFFLDAIVRHVRHSPRFVEDKHHRRHTQIEPHIY